MASEEPGYLPRVRIKENLLCMKQSEVWIVEKIIVMFSVVFAMVFRWDRFEFVFGWVGSCDEF